MSDHTAAQKSPPVQPKPSKLDSPAGRRVPGLLVRIISALIAFCILAGISTMVYFTGMLMFAFSGDAATAGSWPKWIEPFMILGWLVVLGICSLILPLVILFWPRLRFAIPLVLLSMIFPVAWYLFGWITFIVYISNPPAPEPRGPIAYRATQKFENEFSFTLDDAKKFQLKPIEFSLSYPNEVNAIISRPGDGNEFLLHLESRQNGRTIETMRFFPAENVGPGIDPSRLEQLLAKYKTRFPEASSAKLEHDLWNNQISRNVQMEYEEKDSSGKPVQVKLMAMILEPPEGQEHSLIIEIRTYPGSEANEFWAFDHKGMPDMIWNTFEFSADNSQFKNHQ